MKFLVGDIGIDSNGVEWTLEGFRDWPGPKELLDGQVFGNRGGRMWSVSRVERGERVTDHIWEDLLRKK